MGNRFVNPLTIIYGATYIGMIIVTVISCLKKKTSRNNAILVIILVTFAYALLFYLYFKEGAYFIIY